MKWVIGSIAVLVAFVVGVGVGWVARGRKPMERTHHTHVAYTYTPPPRPVPTVTTPPPPWVEDTEPFAWPTGPAKADITAIDATHYLVRDSYLGHVLENQATLMKEARIVPEMVDGGTAGVRVFGIRVGSTLARFGLQNGDRVDTINGMPIARPESALEAYTRIKKSTRFVIGIERRGTHLDLHYLVAP